MFQTTGEGVTLHGQEGRDRRDGDANRVPSTIGHIAFDENVLMELERQVGTVGALDGELGDERGRVSCDVRVARHQEVDDDIDLRSVVPRGHGSHELEAPEVASLAVAVFAERVDKIHVFAVAQGGGIETEVYVGGADVRHVGFGEQQPGHGAADDGEFASEAAQDLADLNQHGLDGPRRTIIVVTGESGFSHSHGRHLEAK